MQTALSSVLSCTKPKPSRRAGVKAAAKATAKTTAKACYRCGAIGHLKADCQRKAKNAKSGAPKPKPKPKPVRNQKKLRADVKGSQSSQKKKTKKSRKARKSRKHLNDAMCDVRKPESFALKPATFSGAPAAKVLVAAVALVARRVAPPLTWFDQRKLARFRLVMARRYYNDL